MGEISKHSWFALAVLSIANYLKTIFIDPELSSASCRIFEYIGLAQQHNNTNIHYSDSSGPVPHSQSASHSQSSSEILTTAHTDQCVEYTLLYAWVLGAILTLLILLVFISSSQYYNKLLALAMASNGIDIELEG